MPFDLRLGMSTCEAVTMSISASEHSFRCHKKHMYTCTESPQADREGRDSLPNLFLHFPLTDWSAVIVLTLGMQVMLSTS